MQERSGADKKFDPIALAHYFEPIQRAQRRTRLALRVAKRRKVVPSDQQLRRLVHRAGVERVLHKPGAAEFERERRAAVDDAIEVIATNRAAPRVEAVHGRFDLEHRDRTSDEMVVDRLAQAPCAPFPAKIDMRDLPARMHARVGASGAVNGYRLPGQREKGLFEDLLDRGAVLLPLPTGKAG